MEVQFTDKSQPVVRRYSIQRQLRLSQLALICCLGCHASSMEHNDVVAVETGCANGAVLDFVDDSAHVQGRLDGELSPLFFLLSLDEDQYVSISTANAATFVDSRMDAALTLFTADGTRRLASVDDSFVDMGVDPELIYRAPHQGTYCIKLETYATWSGMVRYASFDFRDFHLVTTRNDALFLTIADPDVGDSIGQAQSVAFTPLGDDQIAAQIAGAMDVQTEVDFFSFVSESDASYDEGGAIVFRAVFNGSPGPGMPESGISGSGTSLRPLVTLYDDQMRRLAQQEFVDGMVNLTALLQPETRYYLGVEGALAWRPGNNDFYVLFLDQAPLNSLFLDGTDDHNTLETARPFPLETMNGGRQGTVMGTIRSEENVDVYRLELFADDYVEVYCLGASMGSLVDGFSITLTDADEYPLQTQVEAGYPISWSAMASSIYPGIVAHADGAHYLFVSGTPVEADGSHLYECTVMINERW